MSKYNYESLKKYEGKKVNIIVNPENPIRGTLSARGNIIKILNTTVDKVNSYNNGNVSFYGGVQVCEHGEFKSSEGAISSSNIYDIEIVDNNN